jgi:bacillithiol system protein YtxJ
MNWNQLTSLDQLEEIKNKSTEKPQVIFKHSTRCSISIMALNRFERGEAASNVDFYLLDLLSFRNISNEIADQFNVHHQSPQILLIYKGECIFDESHNAITMYEVVEQVSLLA